MLHGLHLGAFVIYLWTLVIAWEWNGFGAVLFSAFLPVISNIYWMRAFWEVTGEFWNPYTTANLSLVAACVVWFVGALIWQATDK